MLKAIVVDTRDYFLSDVVTRQNIADDGLLTIVSTLKGAENLHTAIQQYAPDIVAVCDNIIETQPSWDF